jgi:hypothetical protein
MKKFRPDALKYAALLKEYKEQDEAFRKLASKCLVSKDDELRKYVIDNDLPQEEKMQKLVNAPDEDLPRMRK